MKPIIGITVNCTVEPNAIINKGLALPDQTLQYVADDYVKAVERAGGSPLLIPITSNLESLDPILQILDGIIFTGGSDIDPQYYHETPSDHLGEVKRARDDHEVALAKKVLSETELPYFGICRGSQLLNVVCGGTLYQDIPSERTNVEEHSYGSRSPKHIATHTAAIKENSKLYQIYQNKELPVNSYHHQAVKELGQALEISAIAPDGTVEAIEMTGERFVVAVQWHPEMMHEHDQNSETVFKRFVEVCSRKSQD